MEGHDRPGASGSPGVQSDTDIRQQGSGLIAGDQDKPDRETAAMASPSERSTVADEPGAQHIDVCQQVQGIGPAQDKLDGESAAKASPSASDRCIAADGSSAQRDTDILQQVQGIGPATAGTSVRDEQTHAATDTSDPNNAAAGGHDRPSPLSSPDVQSDTDLRQQGNNLITGDQDKLDREIAPTASPSDHHMAADGGPGTQRDTYVRQQVQGTGPLAAIDEQTRNTSVDVSDPANAAAAGAHDRPAASGGRGIQGDTNVRQQGNGSIAGDQDKLDRETPAAASPCDRPTVANDLGAQRDTDVLQQFQGIGPAAGTPRDEQTRTTTDASDPANVATGRHDRHGPAAEGSPGVRGDTDVCQQGDGTVVRDQDKFDRETVATVFPSAADRPTVADRPGAQPDTADVPGSALEE